MKILCGERPKSLYLLRLSLVIFTVFSGTFYTPVDATENDARVIQIKLGNYRFVPEVIHVNVGESVVLQLVNSDALAPHNFILQDTNGELDVDVALYAGETIEVRLEPKAAGQHTFYCSKKLLFMKSHRDKGMEGSLIVLSK